MNIGGTFCRKYSLSARGKNRGLCGVAPQLVGHLIDDEISARDEGIISLLQKLTLLPHLKNAERDA